MRVFAALCGGAVGFTIGGELIRIACTDLLALPARTGLDVALYAIAVVIFGVAGFFLGPLAAVGFKAVPLALERTVERMEPVELVAVAVGSMFGLILGLMLMPPLSVIPGIGPVLPAIASLSLAYVGARAGLLKAGEVRSALKHVLEKSETSADPVKPPEQVSTARPKVVDTSALIDGRIADVALCGFLDGELVVPEFVLEELKHVKGSSDVLKQNRGKRGLDILDKLMKDPKLRIHMWKGKLRSREVDSKVVELAQLLGGQVITVDYNLNKVAEFSGVRVLNVNDFANAVKPAVLTGERMEVYVLREGKEEGQGVGYLDDGTMVVIDGGKRYIGATVSVEVTSVVEASAGKMIFARPSQAA